LGHLLAPACDDLAGCAAALAALDRARGHAELRHLGVLLTRAEELGFVGALHAAKTGSIPSDARLLSIEASRASTDAPIGDGPVIRVGDAATVFDQELTNLVSRAAVKRGLRHQRRLMSGGSCEATAFGVYGYRATGLCLPLGSYHNMGNLDEVEAGTGQGRPLMEEISLEDFHGLVDLVLVAAEAVDRESDLRDRLDAVYTESRHLLT
jgi:endoglucanase